MEDKADSTAERWSKKITTLQMQEDHILIHPRSRCTAQQYLRVAIFRPEGWGSCGRVTLNSEWKGLVHHAGESTRY